MTVEANPVAPRRSRLLYPGFIISLALNLLFLGGVAAAVWHHHSMQSKSDESGLLEFAGKLAPDRQEAFRQQVLAARASMKSERDSVRTAWINTNTVLTAEPFDKEKFKAAMTQLREVENRYKTGLNSAFADIAASLTPQQRELLHAWRERRKSRHRDHSGSQAG